MISDPDAVNILKVTLLVSKSVLEGKVYFKICYASKDIGEERYLYLSVTVSHDRSHKILNLNKLVLFGAQT